MLFRSGRARLLPQLARPGRGDRARPALPPGRLARPDRAGTRQVVHLPPPLIIAPGGRGQAATGRPNDARNRLIWKRPHPRRARPYVLRVGRRASDRSGTSAALTLRSMASAPAAGCCRQEARRPGADQDAGVEHSQPCGRSRWPALYRPAAPARACCRPPVPCG